MSEHEKTQKKVVDGYTLTYSSSWTKEIESLEHWKMYWHQARLLRERLDKEGRLIEIGVGSGFLCGYLKAIGWDVITLDIDEDKNPDVLGDMSSVDLAPYRPAAIAAFEVFEHVPVPLLKKTLYNFKASGVNKIYFSLPWCERQLIDCSIKLPKIPAQNFRIAFPSRKVRTKNHFWELSKLPGRERHTVIEGERKGCISIWDVENIFAECGYDISAERKTKNIQIFVASISKAF